MTEKIIVKDLAKQDPGSAVVHLYELEYADGQFAYFHDGLDASLGEITMLDYSNNSQTNTYKALPVKFDGLERTAATKFPAPIVTFANLLTTLKVAVSDANFEDFAGNRVIRRTTLRKYLKSEGDTNSPPIEYPRDVYYIDSLKARTKMSVSFQLQAPFDLQGVKIPNRTIVPNRCSWIYQGASEHTENPEYKRARSGCVWHIESKYNPSYNATVADQNVEYTVYVNPDDEYLLPSTTTFTTYSSGAITKGTFYKNTSTQRRFNEDGTVSSVTVNNYWQAAANSSSPGAPSDSSSLWNRIRVYGAYSHGTTYYTYEDDRYNDYVTFTDNTASVGSETYQKTLLWKSIKPSVNIPPAHGNSWERGDMCSKSLKGCGMRFGFTPNDATSASTTPEPDFSTTVVIPFGGFPGSKAFS
jgi:lambda family phage minor tail protein L